MEANGLPRKLYIIQSSIYHHSDRKRFLPDTLSDNKTAIPSITSFENTNLKSSPLKLKESVRFYQNVKRSEKFNKSKLYLNPEHALSSLLTRKKYKSPLNPSTNILETKFFESIDSFIDGNKEPYIKSLFQNRNYLSKIDCQKVANGDKNELNKSIQIQKKMKYIHLPKNYFRNLTKKCNYFKTSRGYITNPLSNEELKFPLAYSIIIYKDTKQVETLLRAIYRPQNFYCIHIDAKSKFDFFAEIESIKNCFSNVEIVHPSVNVRWGQYSVLEPEILCMKQLARYKWKYFINLTGQEFPLKNNYELVRILKAYNGSNDVEGTIKRANPHRWKNSGPPPHGIRPVKGAVHIVVQRGFVDYILHSEIAKDLLEWTKTIEIPDEAFFATLNHNPQLKVPGSYTGVPETGPIKPFLARYKIWNYETSPFFSTCNGKWVRNICIFGMGDYPKLISTPALFANKFHQNFHPLLHQCLEDWLFNKTINYYLYNKTYDTGFYEKLDFVKNKI
ncbi:beta-1,3-galactosyl-O-glycosyl-glycoprotein beta-1,6-N-acetylglucosaminyltransferase-like isoform X1 [Argonauta hians]